MSIKSLTEDFERMGLSGREVSRSMRNLLGEDHIEESGPDEEEEDEDTLDEAWTIIKTKPTPPKKAKYNKAYWAANKAGINKRRSMRYPKLKKRAQTLTQHGKRVGSKNKGARYPKKAQWEDAEVSLQNVILENIQSLANSVDHNPGERFDEFVEAFNNIADLGELLTMRYYEMGKKRLAQETLALAAEAEAVLEGMEELDGVVTESIDEGIEETLAELMEAVAEAMVTYNQIAEGKCKPKNEEDDEETDDEEEDGEEEMDDEEEEDDEELDEELDVGELDARPDVKDAKALAGWIMRNKPQGRKDAVKKAAKGKKGKK